MLDRLPAHVLQLSPVGRRPYTLSQRAACFGVKCVQYGVVGFCMGVLGAWWRWYVMMTMCHDDNHHLCHHRLEGLMVKIPLQ